MATIPSNDRHDNALSQVLIRLTVVEKRLLDGLGLALGEEDTTVEHWRVLNLVSRLDSPTMGDLAESSGIANASLSRIIDSLEDAASVYRVPSPEDRRRITVRLSGHGADRLDRMNSVVAAWETTTSAWLGADTVDALTHAVGLAGQRLDQRRNATGSPTTSDLRRLLTS